MPSYTFTPIMDKPNKTVNLYIGCDYLAHVTVSMAG